jgi:membrane fusion protein (multidrug efflux system)
MLFERNPISFRILKAIAAGLAVAGLLAGAACKEKPFKMPPPEVTVTPVIQRDTPITVEFVGQTKGYEDIDIRARVDGFLQSINFKEGSEVKQGALLYTIDPREYQEKVAQARGQLARAQTMLTNADIEVKRIRPLVAMFAVSQRDMDNAEARQGAAQGEVDAAKAHLAVQELNLSYTRMTSPINGIIGKTKAKVGEFVGLPPNPMILNTVSNVDPILVEFFLSETDYLWAVKIYGAQRSEPPNKTLELELILADGSVFPHKGKVNFADREVDPKTGTILVQASFPNPEKIVRPGQFGRVRFVANVRKGALLLPQRAVQELQGSYQVWVVGPGNKAQIRPVKLGPKVGSLWVVEQGLTPGEQVILEGLTKVEPDMVVLPKPAKETSEVAPAAGQGG